MAQTIKVARSSNIFTATTSDDMEAPLWKFLETLQYGGVITGGEFKRLRGDMGGLSMEYKKLILIFDQDHSRSWRESNQGQQEGIVWLTRKPYDGVTTRDRVAVCIKNLLVARAERKISVKEVGINQVTLEQLLKEVKSDIGVDFIDIRQMKIHDVPVVLDGTLGNFEVRFTEKEAI